MSARPGSCAFLLALSLAVSFQRIQPADAGCVVSASPLWKNSIQFPNDGFRHVDGDGDISWVKFTILTCDPQTVYFQSSQAFSFHYDFATSVLDPFVGLTLAEFNDVSQFATGQEAVLGVVILPPTEGVFQAFPKFQEYGIQFVRNDAYTPEEIVDWFDVVKAAVNADPSVDALYFPAFEQQATADANVEFLAANGVTVSSTGRWANGNSCYSSGWALGRLKFIAPGDIENAYMDGTLSPDDILLTDGIPAEIPYVAGIISLSPSTPNSHVAILADTFDVPFAHLAKPADAARALSLVGRRVVLRSYGDSISCDVRLIDVEDELTPTMADEILELKAPPVLNITPTAPRGAFHVPVEGLSPNDLQYVGGKASNFALLRTAIPDRSPIAMALTFDLWNGFLDQTLANGRTLREEIDFRLSVYSYPPDFAALANDLDDIRDMIKDEDETVFSPALEAAVIAALNDPQFGFDTTEKIRFRSSTNVEDSDQFTGAGLYDSKSGCLLDDLDGDDSGPSLCNPTENNERGVFRAIRRVFDSFYHDNAYLERLRHGVDESTVGMAVLVHHSFPDELELANGVATLRPAIFGYELTLVTQDGAVSVTNPTTGAIPEEVRVDVFGSTPSPRIVTESNLVQIGATVMTWPDDYNELAGLLVSVAETFEQVTGKTDYVLDFEYKRLAPGGAALPVGGLVVKQVREIPQPDTTPSIVPYLINDPTTFEGLGHAYLSAAGRWTLETRTMRLTPENLAAGSIFSDVAIETSDGCVPFLYEGPIAGLPGAAYTYDDLTFQTTDSFTLVRPDYARTIQLISNGVGELVAPSQSPIVTMRDLTFNDSLLVRVNITPPAVAQPGSATMTDNLIGFVSIPYDPDADVNEGTRVYDLPGGGVITTMFDTIPNNSGICCFATQLGRMRESTITGLTTEPLTLRHPMSHNWISGQHNWTETATFEPVAEPGLSPRSRDELLAQDIHLINVLTDNQQIGGPNSSVTFFSAADLGVSCEPCGSITVGDMTGDGRVDGLDIDRFVAVLVTAPAGPNETCAADINGDISVDINDAASFVQLLLAGN